MANKWKILCQLLGLLTLRGALKNLGSYLPLDDTVPAFVKTLLDYIIPTLSEQATSDHNFCGIALTVIIYSYRHLHFSQQIAIAIFILTLHQLLYTVSKYSYSLSLYAQIIFIWVF